MDDMSIVDWLFLFDKIDAETWILWGYVIPGIIGIVLFLLFLYHERRW